MAKIARSKNEITLKERVLEALRAENPDGADRSFFSRNGNFALFADSIDDAKGNEAFVEFALAKNSLNSSNSAGAKTNRRVASGTLGNGSAFCGTPFELYSESKRLFAGVWNVEISVDGIALEPNGDWTTLCEDLTNDYAFLERSVSTTGGRVFSRRMLAVYNEGLFVIADSLVSSPNDRKRVGKKAPLLRYRSTLPLDFETSARENEETREITLVSASERPKKNGENDEDPTPLARVFPLGASEWRDDRGGGDLTFAKKSWALETTAERRGAVLFVPIAIDWNPRRAKRRCSWRPLTVGEALQPVGDDAAIGRKLTLGREQFVLYASTSTRPAIRSVLGRNLLSDFMFGKFFADRGVEPILDVEIVDENR